jgi:uncharacterized protein YjbI with pentapeptide repeats
MRWVSAAAGWVWGNRRLTLTVFGAALGAALLVALIIWLLGPATRWAGGPTVSELRGKDRADAIDAVRRTLLTTAAGAAALIGVLFTARTFYLTRRRDLAERYSKAIAQLAAEKTEERLGGIYALEYLMHDSPRDQQTIVAVLAAFVREHRPVAIVDSSPSAVNATEGNTGNDNSRGVGDGLTTEIRAALTVLARRPQRTEPGPDLGGVNLNQATLGAARLAGADLGAAQLQNAFLSSARLQHAYLAGAQLQDSVMQSVQLQDATLANAQLQRAYMWFAKLQRANLDRVNLDGARMPFACLKGAYLNHARMRGTALYRARLQRAYLDSARLEGADLAEARLQGAILSDAHLQDADLSGANLRRAILRGAQLCDPDGGRPAKGLSRTQLKRAVLDRMTLLPPELRDMLPLTENK